MIYIDTKSTDPFFNFAVEEYFCTTKKMNETIFLLWQTTPTVMVGNFQNVHNELNMQAIQRDKVKVIRRNTGGGTIYTDMGGFQFSFIIKKKTEFIDFGEYMDMIINALKELGVHTEYNSRNDLSIKGKKISGNAQCIKSGYVLHHGSLLYDTNFEKMEKYLTPPKYKIESKGIASVKDRTTNILEYLRPSLNTGEFKEQLLKYILKQDVQQYEFSNEDKNSINQICENKFKTWEWNFGKNPQYTIKKSKKFDGGYLTVALNVENGIIKDCSIYGDFFSAKGVKQLENALVNQYLKKETVKKILYQSKYKYTIYKISPEDIFTCIFD